MGLPPAGAPTGVKGDNYVHYSQGITSLQTIKFGISCAVELFQKVLQQVLQGCEGVQNILDDIITHPSSQKEHDERLEKVLTMLQNKRNYVEL